MAARLTDKQKKKIAADYLECGSYRATARMNGVSADSVKRVVDKTDDFRQKAAQKKEENTADILAYMDSQRDAVKNIIAVGLEVLPEKIRSAKTASEVTTAIGTLIDKWTASKMAGGEVEDLQPLADMLNGGNDEKDGDNPVGSAE